MFIPNTCPNSSLIKGLMKGFLTTIIPGLRGPLRFPFLPNLPSWVPSGSRKGNPGHVWPVGGWTNSAEAYVFGKQVTVILILCLKGRGRGQKINNVVVEPTHPKISVKIGLFPQGIGVKIIRNLWFNVFHQVWTLEFLLRRRKFYWRRNLRPKQRFLSKYGTPKR